MRTTHISGLATDIGIQLAAVFNTLRGLNRLADTREAPGNLRPQVCTVLSFLTGGVAGVILYRVIGGYLSFSVATALCGVAISAIIQSRPTSLSPS